MNALLGKRVGIGISDPWELGEALGWATLQGTISHVGQTPTHYNTVYDAIIVELEKPLEYRNQHLTQIFCEPISRNVGSIETRSASLRSS